MKKLLFILFTFTSTIFAFENLNNTNFDEKLANKNVIVDFYSKW